MIGMGAIYSMPVATVVLIIINYVKGFFGSRGYLTFMLPVKRKTLYYSKLVSAFIYAALNASVLTVVGVIFLFVLEIDKISTLPEIFEFVLSGNPILVVTECFLLFNIIVFGEYAAITLIFEIITEFNLAVKPGGAKKIAGTIVATVVSAYVFIIVLFFSFIQDVYSYNILNDLSSGMRNFHDVASLTAVAAALLALGSVFMARSLYLIENKLNLN